jgi:hypothetical protein
MPLELVLQGPHGPFRTNPSRDIAHFWPDIVNTMKMGLLREAWEPWYRDYLEFHHVTEDMLYETLACFMNFLKLSLEPELDTPLKAIEASGFLNCPRAAQLVILAKLGQLGSGAFWSGVRSSNPLGTTPGSIEQMQKDAEEIRRIISDNWQKPGPWNQRVVTR